MRDKKIDYIVVFSGGDTDSNGEYHDLSIGPTGIMTYEGTRTRMETAIRAADKFPAAKLILVGGYRIQKESDGKTTLHWRVDDMEKYIESKSRGVRPLTIRSLPDTLHNLVALMNSTAPRNKETIVFLSNEYHMERIQTFLQILLNTGAYPLWRGEHWIPYPFIFRPQGASGRE